MSPGHLHDRREQRWSQCNSRDEYVPEGDLHARKNERVPGGPPKSRESTILERTHLRRANEYDGGTQTLEE